MCSMDWRRGRIRWILAQQAIRVFLLLSIILTLIILWLVHLSLDTSHPVRPTYSQSIHQVTAAQQQVYQETTAALKGPHNEHKSGEIIDQHADLDDTCPVFKLMSSRNTSETVACKRADFVPGSCRIMKTLFNSEPANCSHQTMNIICEIKQYNPKKPEVHCHHDVCRIFSKVSIGLYNSEIGEYTWYKLNSIQDLESFINTKLLIDFKDHYSHKGYCLIQCTNRGGKFVSQLLVLPPVFPSTSYEEFRKTLIRNPPLNINILLLDSVSRHHFYRTLPKTIKEFRKLNKYHFKNGRVFDFELLQGIKGRTYESLQALFAGEQSPLSMFESIDLPPKPINLNETLGKFKTYGYETLYMEDMCWLEEWGLVKEQRAMNLSAPFPERLKLFNEAVHRAGIDRLDVSYSSCLILQENKVKNVFHGPPSICYNGIHQHTYLLQYIEYFLSRFSSFYKPTFTFLILDTGHEDTGIRIKQVDDHLARHVSFLAHQSNTISFILSDHGNTYGRFVQETPESQLEIFHPFLFVIIPDQASEILGADKMKSLFINQQRLIGHIDVHYTIKGLLPVKEQTWATFPKFNINIDGLLSPVSISRTCKDIPRIHPNLCICQSSYTLEKNNSYYALFAEFALGSMNREIADMHIGNSKHTCPILVATRFDNIIRSAQDSVGEVFICLDLYVKSSSIVDYPEERFLVSILHSTDIHREGLLFLGFSRLTPYSIYKQCADSTVDIRLCICERENIFGNKNNKQDRDASVKESVLWTRTFRSLVHKPCLYILTRNYSAGVLLSIQNICPDMQYNIRINFLSRNMYSSNKMPVSHVIGPNMENMLVVGISKVQGKPWKYKYSLKFKYFPLSG